MRGNVRIQICTEDKVYFYMVDKHTLEIKLDNVMANYMDCVQMMIGSKVRYCVTYKTGAKVFNVFRANYIHNFKVTVVSDNFEGAKGLELASLKAFLCTRKDGVFMYDTNTYSAIGKLDIELLESNEREPNQVLALQHCQN
jgi:hypothetical protein